MKVYLLTGAVGSGKTTSLLHWSEKRKHVAGILSPVINGERMFMNIRTGALFPMGPAPAGEPVLRVGRYQFGRDAFECAATMIREASRDTQLVIIDEIGPLELGGEGFDDVLRTILRAAGSDVLLVVRDTLVHEVIDRYGLEERDYRTIVSPGEIQ